MRVPIVTVNLTFQWGKDAQLLKEVAETPVDGLLPLVVEGVEARTKDNQALPVAPLLGAGWRTVQDTRSAARAGSFFAVRRGHGLSIREHWMFLLSHETQQGPGVQDRYQQCGIIDFKGERCVLDLGVGHFPVPDTGRHDDAMHRMNQWWDRAQLRRERSLQRGINRVVQWGGDPNMSPFMLAREVGAPHWFGDKPMVNLWSRGLLDISTHSRRVPGADHKVLELTGTPRG